jgi:hypothetical protein
MSAPNWAQTPPLEQSESVTHAGQATGSTPVGVPIDVPPDAPE